MSKPCPFCGYKGQLYFEMNQGYKWGRAECGACSAAGPEVKTGYDESHNAPWRKEAEKRWDERVE